MTSFHSLHIIDLRTNHSNYFTLLPQHLYDFFLLGWNNPRKDKFLLMPLSEESKFWILLSLLSKSFTMNYNVITLLHSFSFVTLLEKLIVFFVSLFHYACLYSCLICNFSCFTCYHDAFDALLIAFGHCCFK